jgi:hypothetical protein
MGLHLNQIKLASNVPKDVPHAQALINVQFAILVSTTSTDNVKDVKDFAPHAHPKQTVVL